MALGDEPMGELPAGVDPVAEDFEGDGWRSLGFIYRMTATSIVGSDPDTPLYTFAVET